MALSYCFILPAWFCRSPPVVGLEPFGQARRQLVHRRNTDGERRFNGPLLSGGGGRRNKLSSFTELSPHVWGRKPRWDRLCLIRALHYKTPLSTPGEELSVAKKLVSLTLHLVWPQLVPVQGEPWEACPWSPEPGLACASCSLLWPGPASLPSRHAVVLLPVVLQVSVREGGSFRAGPRASQPLGPRGTSQKSQTLLSVHWRQLAVTPSALPAARAAVKPASQYGPVLPLHTAKGQSEEQVLAVASWGQGPLLRALTSSSSAADSSLASWMSRGTFLSGLPRASQLIWKTSRYVWSPAVPGTLAVPPGPELELGSCCQADEYHGPDSDLESHSRFTLGKQEHVLRQSSVPVPATAKA